MLLPLAIDWKIIGTLLEIKDHDICMIESNERRDQDRLRAMLALWHKQIDPQHTWKDILDAVETVNQSKGQEIRQHLAQT